jgi:two-component system chemotaxis response regulator CheB
VGHAWTAEALLGARDADLEGAMWIAVRSLQEKVKLARDMASKADAGLLVRRYTAIAEETEHALAVLSERLSTTTAARGEASG